MKSDSDTSQSVRPSTWPELTTLLLTATYWAWKHGGDLQ